MKAFDDKDLRLRSVAPNVRQREAKRRLTDIEIAAGQPGTNLCRLCWRALELAENDSSLSQPSVV